MKDYDYEGYINSGETIEKYMSGNIISYIRIDAIGNGTIKGYYSDGSTGGSILESSGINTTLMKDVSFSYHFEGIDNLGDIETKIMSDYNWNLNKMAEKDVIKEEHKFVNGIYEWSKTGVYYKVKLIFIKQAKLGKMH